MALSHDYFQANPGDPTILFINILFVYLNDEQSVKITITPFPKFE